MFEGEFTLKQRQCLKQEQSGLEKHLIWTRNFSVGQNLPCTIAGFRTKVLWSKS